MSSVAVSESKTQDLVDLWLAEAKLYGKKDPYLGKRRHPRFQWQVPVVLDVDSVDGLQSCVYAQTRDISEGGIGLVCRQRLDWNLRGDGQPGLQLLEQSG